MSLKNCQFVTCGLMFSMSTLGIAGDFQDGGDIQDAIDQAVDGQVISIPAGVYPIFQTIDLRGKEITLEGAVDKTGAPRTTLDGGDSVRIMECASGETADTRIRNLVLTAGRAENGGAMRVIDSSPSLENCVFLENASVTEGCSPCPPGHASGPRDGGALWIVGSSSSFNDCRFILNAGRSGGAIYADGSQLLMENVEFQQNTAANSGGAVFSTAGGLDVDGGWFEYNSSEEGGGGLYFSAVGTSDNDLLLKSVNFASNTALRSGGAAEIGFAGQVILEGISGKTNQAEQRGGGFYFAIIDDGQLEVRESLLTDNIAGIQGGAIYIKSHTTLFPPLIMSSRIEENTSGASGSAVYFSDRLEVGDSTICGNEVLPQIFPADDMVDLGGNCIREDCCKADFNCDGKVDGGDLASLLGDWGGTDLFYDITANGQVDGADLSYLLGTWGDCR